MTYDDELYKKYKYYGITENVTTLGLVKPIYELQTNTIEQRVRYFNLFSFKTEAVTLVTTGQAGATWPSPQGAQSLPAGAMSAVQLPL